MPKHRTPQNVARSKGFSGELILRRLDSPEAPEALRHLFGMYYLPPALSASGF